MNEDTHNSGCLYPSLKHVGDSAVVWGCISASGVGDLFKRDGIMKTNVAHLFPIQPIKYKELKGVKTFAGDSRYST